MELKDILSIAISSLIVIVLAHLAVFWVVRTLYPPTPAPAPVSLPAPPPPVFTQPPLTEQHVAVPTYEAPVSTEIPSKEGERRGPPPPEATAIQREPRVDASNTQG